MIRHSIYWRIPSKLASLSQKNLSEYNILHYRWFWCLFIFSLPPFALFCFGYYTSAIWNDENRTVLITIFIASFWIVIGPLLTLMWEFYYRDFIKNIEKNIDQEIPIDSTLSKVIKRWPSRGAIFGIFYSFLALGLHFLFRNGISPIVYIENFSLVWWTTNAVLIMTGYVTGIGVAGVWHTISLYKAASQLDLRWVPFHADRRGGLSFLSSFALRTSTLFAGGATVVPAVVSMSFSVGGYPQIFGLASLALYIAFVAAIFIWPAAMIFMKMLKEKEFVLNKIAQEINKDIGHFVYENQNSGKLSEETLQHISLYEKVASISVSPISIGAAVNVSANVIVPSLLFASQIAVETGLAEKLIPTLN